MFEGMEDIKPGRADSVSVPHHNRVVIMLVAMCCLSMGVAIGAIVRGIGGATSDDKRLSISTTTSSPDALSAAFARVAEQVEPSVVNINVREGEAFSYAREGTGSGVIVNPSGFIITNQHVIKRATRIKVKLANGKEYDAKIIGQDQETDLAVIKVDAPEPLRAARMGDSDRLNVGDWVLAIGSPFGLDQTVTAGIISAKDRVTDRAESIFQQFLQTDAAINPGNSGGPLVNLAGEVIGINTQIATISGVYNGIGFALPSSTAVEVYNQLVTNGRIRRGFLGVELAELSPQVARLNGIKDYQGVLVNALTDNSPAAAAGIQSGDVIISINGEKVKDYRQLIRLVASLPVGSVTTVTYVREGQQRMTTVKLEERPGRRAEEPLEPLPSPVDPRRRFRLPEKQDDKGDKPNLKPTLGLLVRTLSAEAANLREMAGVRGAIVTTVEPSSVADEHGVDVNDIIVDINHKTVRSEEDFQRICRELKSGDDVVIRLLRKRLGLGPRALTSVIVSFTMP